MKILRLSLLYSSLLLAQAPAKGTSWKVVQLAGPIGANGSKLALTLDGTQLSLAVPKTNTRITIPADQITELVYSPVRFSRARQVFGKHDSPSAWASGAAGNGYAMLLGLMAAGVVSPLRGTSHFVTLTWSNGDLEQQMQFEVGKSDLDSFAQQMRALLGPRWIDIEEQQRTVEALIKDNNQPLDVQLPRDVLCGPFVLPEGTYRALVMIHGSDAELYLFHGEVALNQLHAVVSARVTDSGCDAPLEYAEGSNRLTALRWQQMCLRFPEVP